MEEAIENQGGEFSIGVEFRIADLGGQAGKATIAIARKQKEQAEIGYRKARNTIALEVDTSYRSVLNLRERLEASYKARDLAERNLEAEELLLEQSKGDLYRVIERQQLCGDANTNVVASNALLSKAIIALWLTSGQLFERYAINEEWINPVAEGSGRKHPNGGPARDYGSFGLPFVNRGRGNPR
jgi:outer membrane protein TolC